MNQLINQKPPKCPKKEKNNPETSNEGKNILNQCNKIKGIIKFNNNTSIKTSLVNNRLFLQYTIEQGNDSDSFWPQNRNLWIATT
jgi:hypothetical protein